MLQSALSPCLTAMLTLQLFVIALMVGNSADWFTMQPHSPVLLPVSLPVTVLKD